MSVQYEALHDWRANPSGRGPIEGYNPARTCQLPTEAQMEEAGTYASEPAVGCPGTPSGRCACAAVPGGPKRCPGACQMRPRSVEVNLGTGVATVNGQPTTFEAGMEALRKLNGEPPTRLAMIQEIRNEAKAALEDAEKGNRPNDVYLHGEALAACEELIAYLSK